MTDQINALALNLSVSDQSSLETAMLNYAIIFFVIAIIAGVLGFGGIAGSASSIAQILFVVFLVIAVISFFRGRGKP